QVVRSNAVDQVQDLLVRGNLEVEAGFDQAVEQVDIVLGQVAAIGAQVRANAAGASQLRLQGEMHGVRFAAGLEAAQQGDVIDGDDQLAAAHASASSMVCSSSASPWR